MKKNILFSSLILSIICANFSSCKLTNNSINSSENNKVSSPEISDDNEYPIYDDDEYPIYEEDVNPDPIEEEEPIEENKNLSPNITKVNAGETAEGQYVVVYNSNVKTKYKCPYCGQVSDYYDKNFCKSNGRSCGSNNGIKTLQTYNEKSSTGTLVFENPINDLISDKESPINKGIVIKKSNFVDKENCLDEQVYKSIDYNVPPAPPYDSSSYFKPYNEAYSTYFIYESSRITVWAKTNLMSQYNNDSSKILQAAQNLSNVFEQTGGPLDLLKTLSPDGTIPLEDYNYGKLMLIMVPDSGAAGYFMCDDYIKSALYISSSPNGSSIPTFSNMDTLMAHEGQHLLFEKTQINSGRGVNAFTDIDSFNEGLSCLSQLYLNGADEENNSWIKILNEELKFRNGITIFDNYDYPSLMYGYPFTFILYLLNQYSKGNWLNNTTDFYHKIYSTQYYNKEIDLYLNSIIKTLNIDGIPNIKIALRNYFLSMVSRDSTGLFGFYNNQTFEKSFSNYPLYYGPENKATSIPIRSAITLKTKNNSFTAPTDADKGIEFYVIKKNVPDEQFIDSDEFSVSDIDHIEILCGIDDEYNRNTKSIDAFKNVYMQIYVNKNGTLYKTEPIPFIDGTFANGQHFNYVLYYPTEDNSDYYSEYNLKNRLDFYFPNYAAGYCSIGIYVGDNLNNAFSDSLCAQVNFSII